jgi:hypothetical protein
MATMGNKLSKLHAKRPKPSISENLRRETEDFACIWLRICDNEYKPKSAKPLDASLYRSHWHFKSETDVEFYEKDRCHSNPPPKYPPRLERALQTDSTCLESVYVTFERVCQRLNALPYVTKVEWISAHPRPRLMLIKKHVVGTAEEILRAHDCIRITASDESQYVLDLAGWQFGYDDYFFTWEEYTSKLVIPSYDPEVLDPEEEYNRFPQWYSDCPERVELVKYRKREISKASDEDLRKFAEGVTLAL